MLLNGRKNAIIVQSVFINSLVYDPEKLSFLRNHKRKEGKGLASERFEKKELKRLSRQELLELLLAQTEELQRCRAENEELKAKLEDRELKLSNAGSIAEAALSLSGIFEAAQKAADEYLYNIRLHSEAKEKLAEGGTELN